MKYRLKSRSLQLRLDEISGGDFTKQFNDIARIGKDPFVRSRTVYFELVHDSRILISIEVTPDMVDEIQEYNPKKWNVWPDVTPPSNVLMRIQSSAGDFMCAIWMDRDSVSEKEKEWIDYTYEGMWYTAPNGNIDELYQNQWFNGTDSEILFRPWDEEENEECQ